jgi:hypothetical protein
MEVGDRARIGLGALVTLLMAFSSAWATPTFQVYINGATAGDVGEIEETWIAYGNAFDLVAVGGYSSKTVGLHWATLIVSVPQGETGTLSIAGATLLTAARDTGVGDVPDGPAGLNLLSNVGGMDGYDNKSPVLDLNNHFPYKNSVANFLYYAIGDFDNDGPIHNYNAGDGSITLEGTGEEKTFAVSVTGFSWVHFDLGGYVENDPGRDAWEINPGSHDATGIPDPVIPVPGSLLLAALGAGLVSHIRRRKAL